jgi:hypothetical protein
MLTQLHFRRRVRLVHALFAVTGPKTPLCLHEIRMSVDAPAASLLGVA